MFGSLCYSGFVNEVGGNKGHSYNCPHPHPHLDPDDQLTRMRQEAKKATATHITVHWDLVVEWRVADTHLCAKGKSDYIRHYLIVRQF